MQAMGDQPKSGLYEHKIIQTAINICLFKNRLDLGVEFTSNFRPPPVRCAYTYYHRGKLCHTA